MLNPQQMGQHASAFVASILTNSNAPEKLNAGPIEAGKRRAKKQKQVAQSTAEEKALLALKAETRGDIRNTLMAKLNGRDVRDVRRKEMKFNGMDMNNDQVALANEQPPSDELDDSSLGQEQKRHLSSALSSSGSESKPDSLTKTDNANREQQQQLLEESSELAEQSENGADLTKGNQDFKADLVWTNIILFVILHSSLPIGVYMLLTQWPWRTLIWSIFGMYASGLGVTGGSHRLWSHRSYKASWPVQALLVALQTMAGQNSIYTWSRDHRVHHKFAETNADPHNIKRGFFFAHMGWLCCKKHPDVKSKGKLIDMSDLEANPFVMFQHRHFWWMSVVFTVLLPTMIPVWLWQERFWTSFIFSFMVRYLITLHGTWLVNSAAHYYGDRPYDVAIEARESPYVIYNALGEGFHNYHHTFPYDYATSEFGKYLNITTTFIDLCAALRLVQDRRKVDQETIMKRRLRTGNLTEQEMREHEEKKTRKSQGMVDDSCKLSPADTSCRSRKLPKSIDETDELAAHVPANGPLAPLSNIIHELPYISGLTSMKYTM